MKFIKYFSITIILIVLGITIDFFINRNVTLYEELEEYSERELQGHAWLVISSPEQALAIEEKHNVNFPVIDYDHKYLLECQGRRIKSLKYKKISKWLWSYDVPMGIEEFEEPLYPHTIFIYIIDKHKIKQKGD